MGLDWIAFELNEEGEEWNLGTYRGKGVAYDKNLEDMKEVTNACYGDTNNVREINGDDGEKTQRNHIMTREQKKIIEDALEELLDKDEADIDTDGEEYQEWRDWMEGALEFLREIDYDEDKYIWCWF